MKAGAIVPMKNMDAFDNSVENPERMEVRIFPAEEGSFVLWVDEGDTPEDKDDNWVSTRLSFTSSESFTDMDASLLGELCEILLAE